MTSRSQFFTIFLATVFGALFSAFIIVNFYIPDSGARYKSISQHQSKSQLVKHNDSSVIVPEGLNFINAANAVIPGVVHIRALYANGSSSLNPLERYYNAPAQSSGSGVIISEDGFIATNNHVVDEASEIEVILNDNRSFLAKVIGTDPTTDLALLKIDGHNFNYVSYGDSDNVLPGEWVLAIGNPFELNSTVTAGIVSAKARNIGILRDRSNLQIESFIQTDAAVNPGNSGGALVNLRGELIGINTAIATPNGSYAGYSFAVPVTLVKKVMDDLYEFGTVQRGLLGIRIGDVDARVAAAQGLNVMNGVIISDVNDNSSAQEAGLQRGDVIIAINDKIVTNVSELQELVARNRPGDQVSVTYLRDGLEDEIMATLRNTEGNTEILAPELSSIIEGASLEELSAKEADHANIEGGVRIKKLVDGKWKAAGVKENFIITRIDKVLIFSINELHHVLENKDGGILIEGIYPDGEKAIYGIDW